VKYHKSKHNLKHRNVRNKDDANLEILFYCITNVTILTNNASSTVSAVPDLLE
jgi:hypothetical protein